MTPYEIPFSGEAETFQIALAGVLYTLTAHWCAPSACWLLDIATFSGQRIVSSIPLVTGTNLLGQHKHLGIGGSLYVQSHSQLDLVPAYTSLGTSGRLYFITP